MISNALGKALKSDTHSNYFKGIFTASEREYFNKNTHTDIKKINSLLGEDKVKELYNFLSKNGFIGTQLKKELSVKLDNVLKQSKNYNEFLENCEKQGIYCRRLFENGKPYHKYGLKDYSFYCSDTNLSGRFRYDNLVNNFNKPPSREIPENLRENFIRYADKIISEAFQNPEITAFPQFKENLSKSGIDIVTHENKRGIYGVSFKPSGDDNICVKASEVRREFSYNNLNDRFINFNSYEYSNTTVPVTILSESAEMEKTLMQPEYNIIDGIANVNISAGAKGRQEEMDIKKNLRKGGREK